MSWFGHKTWSEKWDITSQYESEQAEISRNFQAQQAQIARDWQEEQYNKYNSVSAQMKQYQENNINPALMFGGSIPEASTATSVPSGAQASAPSVSDDFSNIFGNVTSLIGQFGELAKLKAEINNINADTRNKNADSVGREIENGFKPELLETELKQGKLNVENTKLGVQAAIKQLDILDSEKDLKEASVTLTKAQVDKIYQDISKTEIDKATELLNQKKILAETATEEEKRKLVVAQVITEKLRHSLMESEELLNYQNTDYIAAKTLSEQLDNENKDDLGFPIGASVLQAIPGLVTHGLPRLIEWYVGKLIDNGVFDLK